MSGQDRQGKRDPNSVFTSSKREQDARGRKTKTQARRTSARPSSPVQKNRPAPSAPQDRRNGGTNGTIKHGQTVSCIGAPAAGTQKTDAQSVYTPAFKDNWKSSRDSGDFSDSFISDIKITIPVIDETPKEPVAPTAGPGRAQSPDGHAAAADGSAGARAGQGDRRQPPRGEQTGASHSRNGSGNGAKNSGFVPLSTGGREGGAQRSRALSHDEKQEQKYQRSIDSTNLEMKKKLRRGDPAGSIVGENQKKRAKKNRISGIVVIVAFVAAALVAVSLLVYNFGVKIKDITVEQSTIYPKSKVEAVSGIAVGDSLFSVRRRSKEIAAAIEKELPMIGSVEIDIEFPDKLHLIVTETKENCVLVIGQDYIWTDSSGKVLEIKKKKIPAGVYKVTGLLKSAVREKEDENGEKTVENVEQEYEIGDIFVPITENETCFNAVMELASTLAEYGYENVRSIDCSDKNEIVVRNGKYIVMLFDHKTDFVKAIGHYFHEFGDSAFDTDVIFDMRGEKKFTKMYGTYKKEGEAKKSQ